MNIMSYLNQPSFEDFVDSPAVTDLAHNAPSATGEAAPVAAAAPTAPADSIEIPESTGPELVASADEAQAAAIVEDPGHSEAEQMAQAATVQDAALLGAAETTPGAETAVTEETTDVPAGDAPVTDEVSTDAVPETDATTDVGGDGTDTSGELGDVAADDGLGDASTDEPLEETAETTEETTSEEIPAGDASGDAAVEEPVEETTTDEPVSEEPLEEDGLGEVTEPETEETEDGLGDGTSGDTETGEAETNTDDQEAGGEETEGEEETSEEEESTDEETGGEEESTEETSEEVGEDDEEGVEYDIPDIDTETTDEDVADAEEDAAEAVAEEEELDEEIVDTSKSVAELDEEDVAVENFIGVLSHGVNTKKFNPQTVALAQAKLQALATKFGSEAPVIPSMEDYTHNNLGEYYTNSLESFSGFLKKIRHARKNFFDDFAKSMNDKIHLKTVETQIDALNKKCDQSIMSIKDMQHSGMQIKIPVAIRYKEPILKGLAEELKWLNDVATVFALDKTFLEGMTTALKAAVKEGDAVKATSQVNKVLKLKAPAKGYPANLYSGSPTGVMKFVKSEKAATGSIVDDMKTLAERSIPELTGSNLTGYKGGRDKEDLSKADLVKLLQFCKVLIGLSRGTAGSAAKAMVDSIDVYNRTSTEKDMAGKKEGDAEAVRRVDAALNHMGTAYWKAMSMSLDNYSHFQWRIIHIVDGILATVNRGRKYIAVSIQR